MDDRAPRPVEALLVTGPLGAGKTTLVNRLLHREIDAGHRVALLINEFGAVSVDDALLKSHRPELAGIENLVNGCVCCSLRSEVVATLACWCGMEGPGRPDRILIETTGLADPTDLVDLADEPGLAGRFQLTGCLTVVSALTPLEHLERRPLLRHQVALASLVHISKADVDPSLAMAWESQVRRAFPDHPIVRTRQGLAPEQAPDPWLGHLPGPTGEAPVAFAEARSATVRFDHPIDPEGLEALFQRPPAGGELLRAKGVMAFAGWPSHTGGGDRWALQLADGRLEVMPLPSPPHSEPPPLALVVIGMGLDLKAWRRALRALERPPAGARRKVVLGGQGCA
ncbi:MAG: putative GTP-binding protein YjiA [Acidobacteria bacterium ADurb.Bin340]|nr:MAG: putative GTP-binding protein YjiA [Acidobacteria bacterium ADurb.Bin340]